MRPAAAAAGPGEGVTKPEKVLSTNPKVSSAHFRKACLTKHTCVTGDAHGGLKRAIQEAFPGAAWQRCAVHLMRDCMREAGSRSLKRRVGRIMSPVFRAKDAATARAMHHVACDMLRECRPKAADVAEEAEPDALAYLAFPPSHRSSTTFSFGSRSYPPVT